VDESYKQDCHDAVHSITSVECVSQLQQLWCVLVVNWPRHRTLDQEVVCSTPVCSLTRNNPGHVVYTDVPLSPISIIRYRTKGGDALWLGS